MPTDQGLAFLEAKRPATTRRWLGETGNASLFPSYNFFLWDGQYRDSDLQHQRWTTDCHVVGGLGPGQYPYTMIPTLQAASIGPGQFSDQIAESGLGAGVSIYDGNGTDQTAFWTSMLPLGSRFKVTSPTQTVIYASEVDQGAQSYLPLWVTGAGVINGANLPATGEPLVIQALAPALVDAPPHAPVWDSWANGPNRIGATALGGVGTTDTLYISYGAAWVNIVWPNVKTGDRIMVREYQGRSTFQDWTTTGNFIVAGAGGHVAVSGPPGQTVPGVQAQVQVWHIPAGT